MQDTLYTKVHYSKHISVVVDNEGKDERSIVCNHDVRPGELLLVEQIVCQQQDVISSILRADRPFRCALAPRVRHIDEADVVANPTLIAKIDTNVFDGPNEGELVIGNVCSCFNHSCDANAEGSLCRSTLFPNNPLDLYFVFAVKAIAAGQEICISYGRYAGHEDCHFGFQCNCGTILSERLARRQARHDLVDGYHNSQEGRNACRSVVADAIASGAIYRVSFLQRLASFGYLYHDGCFWANDTGLAISTHAVGFVRAILDDFNTTISNVQTKNRFAKYKVDDDGSVVAIAEKLVRE